MRTPLHLSTRDPEMLKLLLDHGALIPLTDGYDNTALHVAIYCDHLPSVKVLLDAGANVNQRGHLAETALCRSIKHRNIEVAKVLIDAGADPTLLDYYGRNCFDWAASLRLDIPLPHSTFTDAKDPSAVKDTLQQGMLFALHRPTKISTMEAVKFRLEEGICYDLLGRLLLFQNRKQDACTAFEQDMQRAIGKSLEDGLSAACDMCDVWLPRPGETDCIRFVCSICRNIDLCFPCMEKYNTTREIRKDGCELCEDHEYLKVPSKGWRDLPAGKINKQGETEDEWFARLLNDFEDGSEL